jgi:HEAT repeat protein
MIEKSPIYNEPVRKHRGDRIPKLGRIGRLDPIVRTRFELENALRACGNSPGRPLKLGKMHVTVLLAMLSETDSPLSASLRARTVGVVGFMKIKEAAPVLTRMALNEEEDMQTRLNAIGSFIQIRRYAAIKDIGLLVQDKNKLVRVATYLAAMKSYDLRLAEAAEKLYKKESDKSVRYMVTRRIPKLKSESRTQPDSPQTGT